MALSTYQTGTVAVGTDGAVTVTDGIWSGLTVVSGDMIAVDGGAAVLISDVSDATHGQLVGWSGGSVSGKSYVVYQVSSLRFDDVQIALDLQKQVQALNTEGFYVFVPSASTEPDPSLGDDGQYAQQAATGKLWIKESGVWTYLGIYKGLGAATPWSSATAYTVNDVATLNGSSYICILAHTNHTPPNATYWAVLAAKGDTGATGPASLKPIDAWVTATAYVVGPPASFVSQAGAAYECLVAHTSGTFNTDLAAGKWGLVAAKGTDGTGVGDMVSANNLSELTDTNVALDNLGVARPVASAFATVADVQAASIPAAVARLQTVGYYAAGDGGGSIATNATYERVGSAPSHSGYIQSADGAYWELTGKRVSVRQFGAVPVTSNLDTDPDAAAAINLCMAYCNLKHSDMFIPSGAWPLDAAITSPTFIIEINGQQGGGQPTILYKRYTEASSNKGVISLGAWGARITDLNFAANSGASGGSAISAILPNVAPNIGILRLDRVYVSGGNGFNYDLYIDGSANTNVGGPSYRSAFAKDCHFFGSAITPIYLYSLEHFFVVNMFLATTGGSVSSGNILNIDGTSSAPCDDIHIHSSFLAGSVSLSRLSRSSIISPIANSLTTSSSCDGVTVLSVGGAFSNSGTNCVVLNDNSAWTAATPTVTASSGSFTSASCALRYKIVGKTATFTAVVTMTTAGTAAGNILFTLPFTPAYAHAGGGKETNAVGFQLNWQTIGSQVAIAKYDNTTIIATGRTAIIQGVIEIA